MNLSIKLLMAQLLLRNIVNIIQTGTQYHKDVTLLTLNSSNAILILVIFFIVCHSKQRQLIHCLLQLVIILQFEIAFLTINYSLYCAIIYLVQVQIYLSQQNLQLKYLTHGVIIYLVLRFLIQEYNNFKIDEFILLILWQPFNHYLIYQPKKQHKKEEQNIQLQTITSPQVQITERAEELLTTKKDINEDFFDCIPEGLVILDEFLKVVKHNAKILQYLQIKDPKNIPASLDTLLRLAQKNRQPQKKKLVPLKCLKQNSDMSMKFQGSLANSLKRQFWVSDRINFTKGDSLQYPFLQPILNDFKLSNENMTINSEGSIIKYQLIQETLQKQRHLQIKIYEIQMLSHSKNPVFLFIVENITNKEQLRLLRTRFKFQQSLLNSFSHELRTPLNCTLSLLQTLKNKLMNVELAKQFLNPAIVSSQRLLYQINDILDYAQIECQDFKTNITEFRVGDIFQTLKDFFSQECSQKQIELIIDNDNLIVIRNDKDRITQVLINLINNSIKFTPQGGRIIVNMKKRDNLYQFTVWDNGKGISNLTMSNIFESNYNNDKVLESSSSSNKLGLGLRVSRAIAKNLCDNGDLVIKSQQGSYTSVNFFVNDQTIKANEDITDQDSLVKIASKQIVQKCECAQALIVDDVPFNHIAMIAMLTNFGIKSESAYDGQQAIEKVNQRIVKKQCCQTYRLIFMDVEMPGKNGFQTSQEIVQLLNNTLQKSVIVMCSAYSGEENIEQARQCGMKEVIPKPISIKDLQSLITKYFQSISQQ